MPESEEDTDFARIVAPGTLVIQRWLPGPVERVWRYLVDDDKRRKWLAAGEMDPVAGASFDLTWRNDDLSAPTDRRPAEFPEVQRLQSRVISIDPPKQLVIAWGNGDVTFDLTGRDDRVLLSIRHTGLAAGPVRTEVAGGWHMHLSLLADQLSGRMPGSFWSGWVKLRDQYADLGFGAEAAT